MISRIGEGEMAKMNVWELLVKVATILRLPRYDLTDGRVAYDRKLIEEILVEIESMLTTRE